MDDYSSVHRKIVNKATSEVERTRMILYWQSTSQQELISAVERIREGRRFCKLHIGAGHNTLKDWINTDCIPYKEYAYYLDARQKFPLGDSICSHIFSEHMIEHVSLDEAKKMLLECSRVLREGGKMRIATPDLAKILTIYSSDSGEVAEYKVWAQGFNRLSNDPTLECSLINNFVRAWGHQFIYDERTLRHILEASGFEDVRRCLVGKSRDPRFRMIERHGERIGSAANEFETMVIEAKKGSKTI